jgi:hypothetical protein
MRTDLVERIVHFIKSDRSVYEHYKYWGQFSDHPYDLNNVEYPESPILLYEEGDVQVIIELEYDTLFITHLTADEYELLDKLLKKMLKKKRMAFLLGIILCAFLLVLLMLVLYFI